MAASFNNKLSDFPPEPPRDGPYKKLRLNHTEPQDSGDSDGQQKEDGGGESQAEKQELSSDSDGGDSDGEQKEGGGGGGGGESQAEKQELSSDSDSDNEYKVVEGDQTSGDESDTHPHRPDDPCTARCHRVANYAKFRKMLGKKKK